MKVCYIQAEAGKLGCEGSSSVSNESSIPPPSNARHRKFKKKGKQKETTIPIILSTKRCEILPLRIIQRFILAVPREACLRVVGMCPQKDQICLNTPRSLSLQEEDLKSGHIFYGLPPPRPGLVEKSSAAFPRRCGKQPGTHVVLCYMYT